MKRILLMILLGTLIACSNNVTNNDDSVNSTDKSSISSSTLNDSLKNVSTSSVELPDRILVNPLINEGELSTYYIDGSYNINTVYNNEDGLFKNFLLKHNKGSNFRDIIIPVKINEENNQYIRDSFSHREVSYSIRGSNEEPIDGGIILCRTSSDTTFNIIIPNEYYTGIYQESLNTEDLNIKLILSTKIDGLSWPEPNTKFISRIVTYYINIKNVETPLLNSSKLANRIQLGGQLNMGINYYLDCDNITASKSASIYASGLTGAYNSDRNKLVFSVKKSDGQTIYLSESNNMNGTTFRFNYDSNIIDSFGAYSVNLDLIGWQGKAVYRKEFSIFKPSTLPQNLTSEFYNNPPKLNFNVSSSENENITFKVTRYTHKNAFDPIPIASKTFYVNNNTEFTDNDFVNHYTNQPGLSSYYGCVFSIIEPSQFVNYLEYKIEVRLDGDKIEEHTVYYQYELYPENQGPGGPGGGIPN